MPPTPNSVWVNAILGGRLRERLVGWRVDAPRPVSHDEIAVILDREVQAYAERQGVELPTVHGWDVRRWCITYGIEPNDDDPEPRTLNRHYYDPNEPEAG